MAARLSAALLLVLTVVVAILISAAKSQSTVSCSNVENEIAPCLGYLTGNGPLTSECCTAVSGLNSQVSGNSAALQSTCQCLQSAANSLGGIDYGNAENLPEQCGVSLPFSISPDVNCNNL